MTPLRRNLLIAFTILGSLGLWLTLYRAHEETYPAELTESSTSNPLAPASGPAGAASNASPPAPPGALGHFPASPRSSPSAIPQPGPPQPVSTPLAPGAENDSAPGVSPPPVLAPEIAVQAVQSAVQKYGATFGGNPVGTNAEITRALNGDNPTHARFLSGIPGQRIDSNGQLVDPWGTAYFFHQLSGRDMEVRSAGPDHIMWNSDDLIVK